jgi:succinate dehydrogenase/fumarate reductase-like Fe-S protein
MITENEKEASVMCDCATRLCALIEIMPLETLKIFKDLLVNSGMKDTNPMIYDAVMGELCLEIHETEEWRKK